MFPCVNVPLYVRLGFFHNADLQTLGWNGLWWCDSCRCYHMENSVWQCAECVSRSDGRCLFVLCTKRSASVSACWDVRHLMTLFPCVCLDVTLSTGTSVPVCVPAVSLISWVCVFMCSCK